jgi:AAA ATPase domain/Bacterial regulatory proteins, luxR family
MIGRDDELRVIDQSLSAARAGQGSTVFVTGEGGIGKSRLAAAAADAAFAADMRLLRGRGSSIGPMVPFRSLTEALMSVLRSGDQLDAQGLGPYLPVLARLIPDLGPAPPGDGGSLVVIAEAVLRLLGLVGRDRGCLLVLDDLQDSDAESLAVVDYLVSNLDRQPVVLLAAIRADPSPALELARSAAQRGCAALIELRRLDMANVRSLACSCLDDGAVGIPAEVVDHLWAASEGIPLLAEVVLNAMITSGALVREETGWRVAGRLRTRPPTTLTLTMAGQMERIGQHGRELLSAAAIFGRRFPLAVVQAATGMGQRELLSHLHGDIAMQFVAPDEQLPDWYAFQHPLVGESILSLLGSDERRRLALQVAMTVEAIYPKLPGEWCQTSATLYLQAGDDARAGRLFAEAGRRAMAQGAANSAVALLDRALELLTSPEDAQERADAFASLLYALAEAGLVERAVASVSELERLAGILSRSARAQLHTRLAWAAAVAGRSADGILQVEIARKLLGPDAAARDTAPIDVVAAHLALDVPGPGQVRMAETLALRAAEAAESARLPDVACQAWQLLGALRRTRDPDEATACLERARSIAVQHALAIEEIHTLVRLGNDDALRDGRLDRLRQAQREASQAGAVTSRYQAEASIALQLILRAEFADAWSLIDQVLAATMRLRLLETTRYTLLLRAILSAHQAQRAGMEAALAELSHWEGDHSQHTPRVHGLARAFCALLEENRPLALRELGLALAAEEQSPSIFQLTGRYGLNLLLRVIDGTIGQSEYQAITAAPASRLRWDRQFAVFADAVLAGRAGRGADAGAAVAEAMRLGAPYPGGRYLGLRLVAAAAITDGWGSPVSWLRDAEQYFFEHDVPAVASACRALMRRAGVTVAQRREGREEIPPALRAVGVTVREYEILQLVTLRLSNREIAARLHLSPRTVEKHVASLIVKTSQPDRIALSQFGSA